ncbi:DNA (cytosine-5-)-methyltransferase [Streptomyces tremellae]|uniref:DNA (cytosine-5-)-methyltransferase n=1 Tax=Streptomyces tremellae TaxID=1124239 RepID=A0ABP7FHH6_9ACTN
MRQNALTVIELCAGVGGQALGLEQAGFCVTAVVDADADTCRTLSTNRPEWHPICDDLRRMEPVEHPSLDHADVLSCGLPRSPYSEAGKQLGDADSRDALQATLDMASWVRPRALLLENIPTFLRAPKFEKQRRAVRDAAEDLGYEVVSTVLDATDFGVPQRRKHAFLVAMRPEDLSRFSWPLPTSTRCPTLGETLRASMAARGWPEADKWAADASEPAPLIMGGATGRGGADLGATRAKKLWARQGVYGGSIGDAVPDRDFRLDRTGALRDGLPRLTVDQVSLLQSMPEDWRIYGKKTSAYRQVSQATPPPVARAVGLRIAAALRESDSPGIRRDL